MNETFGSLLACPGCTLGDPIFLCTAMVVGTVPLAFWMLRPFARSVKKWGVPQITGSRLLSLAILTAGLIPFWKFCVRNAVNEKLLPLYFIGIFLALTYLWWRGCELLDAHRVSGKPKELLFPGVIGLGLAALGTATGILFLGLVAVIPFGQDMIFFHIGSMLIIVVPLFCVIKAGLNYIFGKPVNRAPRTRTLRNRPTNLETN